MAKNAKILVIVVVGMALFLAVVVVATTDGGRGLASGVSIADSERYVGIDSGVLSGDSKVVSIASGGEHTCALFSGGRLKCWGKGENGQVGDGYGSNRYYPTVVVGVEAVAVSAGLAHSCAIDASRAVWCWGSNTEGQVGRVPGVNVLLPTEVSGLGSGVVSVSAGGLHTCALGADHRVRCWGDNEAGQLGNGTSVGSAFPVQVLGLDEGVVAISAGAGHTCAITLSGGVWCWGDNASGVLGDGTFAERRYPSPVLGLGSGVVAISAGAMHTCAIDGSGRVLCWGQNSSGQLGDGTTAEKNIPTPVVGLDSGGVVVSCGGMHTCVVTSAHGVRCWGIDGFVPKAVAGLETGIVSVSSGLGHICVVTEDEKAMCWLLNDMGQLGDGTTAFRFNPTPVGVSE